MPVPTRLGDLATLVRGTVRGDSERVISGVRSLDSAGPGDLAPLTSSSYRDLALKSRAGALLVAEEDPGLVQDQLVCAAAAWALAPLLEHFHPTRSPAPGIHATAVVAEGCQIDETAHLGPYVVVGEGSRVGPGAVLHPGVVVGRNCRIGAGSVLHPRVVLYDDTELGSGVVAHAGAVLGSDGFGYAPHQGKLVKIPQVGRVVVEDGVEIGANSAVDRATLEETRLGAGSKLDNLVQVGHNVQLGAGCVICGQAGIAGSARLGRGVVMGGQAGAIGHVEIGDGAQIAAKSAALQAVAAGRKVAGVPAVELGEWRRQTVWMGRLGELFRRLRALERRFGGEED